MTTTESIVSKSITYPTLAQLREQGVIKPIEKGSATSAASYLKHNNWPRRSHPEEIAAFYGAIEYAPNGLPSLRWQESKLTDLALPFPMRLAHQLDHRINAIRCHVEVKPSLSRILEAAWEYFGRDLGKAQETGFDILAGCWGTYTHANPMATYGASIVINPARNKTLSTKPAKVTGVICTLPTEIIAYFLTEGWYYAGAREKHPNFSLFQAANP